MVLQDLLFTLDTDCYIPLCTNNETFPENLRFNCEKFTSLYHKIRKTNQDDILMKKIKEISVDHTKDCKEYTPIVCPVGDTTLKVPIYPLDIYLEVDE